MFSYRHTDGSINLQLFKAEYLSTPEECASVMAELDQLRSDIDDQIRRMRASFHNDGERTEAKLYHSTMNLWTMAKIARNKVQDRRGILRRQINVAQADAHNTQRERGFVNAAKKLLSKEQYLAIWRLVDEDDATRNSASPASPTSAAVSA